jgi:S-adenosylmethionine decarboxylase
MKGKKTTTLGTLMFVQPRVCFNCGYSMNAIEGAAISTIHVTPEDGFSYSSFEAAGYDFEDVNLSQLVERVLACFQPTEFSVALHTDIAEKELGIKFPL